MALPEWSGPMARPNEPVEWMVTPSIENELIEHPAEALRRRLDRRRVGAFDDQREFVAANARDENVVAGALRQGAAATATSNWSPWR